jgi:hypothetical protein
MCTWRVHLDGRLIDHVTADRAYVRDGALTFFNQAAAGSRFGDTVSVFAPGQWTHFNIVQAAE